jgi:hypothetical protein
LTAARQALAKADRHQLAGGRRRSLPCRLTAHE